MSDQDIFSEFTSSLWSSENSPPELYHYTSTEGFRSIINNGVFWVSSFETMNDNQELRKGLEIAKAELREFINQITSDEDILANWDKFLIKETNTPTLRPYVASFTDGHDSHLHWETYANKSSGVALKLTKQYSVNNKLEGFFVKLSYNEITATDEFKFNLQNITNIFTENWTPDVINNEVVARRRLADLFHAYLQLIFKFAISLKDSHWAGEQEWRLVIFASPELSAQSAHGAINFRSRAQELVDYLEVSPLKIGYKFMGAKKGHHFPSNSRNGFNIFLKEHSLTLIE